MLRHDDSSETDVPAAKVRVTPQELAAAITRLEARQGGLDGTIPLGDAVQELGLDVTPDELLREIEAGRARQQENQPRTRLPLSNRLRIGIALALSLVLTGGTLLASLSTDGPAKPAVAVIAASAAPRAAPIITPDNLLVQRSDHKLVLLSEVPDDQAVLCLLEGTANGARLADYASAASYWTLIKHGGKVYVRGWIGDMSGTALQSSVVTVHISEVYLPSGLHPVPITLPLGGFQSPPGLTNDTMISASHVVPDEHLKEKW